MLPQNLNPESPQLLERDSEQLVKDLFNQGLDNDQFLKESFLLDLLPSAVYVCDVTGRIRRYNRKAAELWGREPDPGDKDERFCGSYRLYLPDGTPLPHNQTPVAGCLLDGVPRKNLEVVIERPDRTRITVNVNIVPIRDSTGNITGVINCFQDITELKNSRDELDRKCEELQDYVDNAPIGLHWVDADGIILWANKAELDMLGYQAEEYVGHHIAEFHADPSMIADILGRLHRKETLDQYQSLMRCRDGGVKVVSINSNVLWQNGEFIHTRCFTVDISQQIKYLRALEESEGRHRQLLENLPVALYTCDRDGRITMFNEAAVNIWGRRPSLGEEYWCGSWKMFDTEGNPMPPDKCPMAITLRERRYVYGTEIVIQRPDGTRRHVLPNPVPIFDNSGELAEAINVLVDITELRTTEYALRESEDRFRKAADSAPVLFWMTDDAGRRIFHNKTWTEFTGLQSEDDEDQWLELLHPDDRSKYLEISHDAYIEKKKYTIEYRLRQLSGSYRWVMEQATPRFSSAGTFEGYFGSCIDIEEKRTMTDTLRKEVERQTAELKQANHRLRRYNEQLEQFAYTASHDLKEPLRKVQYYNTSLYDTSVNLLPPKQQEYLERSLAAVKRMQGLIESLLLYSTTASTIPPLETVSIEKVIKDVIDNNRITIDEKKALIDVSEMPNVQAVPFQMTQLFDNLIGNALKYSQPGRRPVISIRHQIVKDPAIPGLPDDRGAFYHKFTVADNGIGFGDDSAADIFNLFHRLHPVSQFQGSGIGLAICKKIVENHQGFISANGKQGEGAVFEFLLPI